MDKYYFYDVNCHRIVEVFEDVYKLLEIQKQTGENVDHPTIEKLKANGFLSTNRVKEVEHPATNVVKDFLNNKLKKINLQITQQCNFRCEYCVYSGEYENRGHSVSRMSWETAKKGIDFILSHSKDSSSIDVSFYGGEPLLEYNLIKKVMKYAKEAAEGKLVSFSMTTNGSLLNEEMVRFFLDYNMRITVSLDGPKEIHDKNRKFASNNNGTFDSVYNNIRTIVKNIPEFRQRLQYSMVIDPTIKLNCLDEFIVTEDELFDDTTIMGSFISNVYRKDKLSAGEDFSRDWEYSRFKYFLNLLNRVSDTNNLQILRTSNSSLLDFISKSKQSVAPLGSKDHHAGPCIPGQIRLFMSTDGNFFPCERVSEKSEIMKIGSINEGLNLEKVKYLLNVGKLTEDKCKNCFAFRGCIVCSAMADNGDEGNNKLSRDLKLEACSRSRFIFEELLKDACTLQDMGFKSDMIKIKKDY